MVRTSRLELIVVGGTGMLAELPILIIGNFGNLNHSQIYGFVYQFPKRILYIDFIFKHLEYDCNDKYVWQIITSEENKYGWVHTINQMHDHEVQ